MRINTNVPALQAYNALNATNTALQKSINKLSTGLRINSAADDAAGLAISEKMRGQYNGLDRATSNAQDGISMIQTAEGALNETHSILQRMRELSVQAANDTLTQEDRSYIQLEVDQLKEEITRISNTTQFNKKQLLDGSAAAIWSSDKLSTKAIINGGLRSIDQFGQKVTTEGNYKITVKATPGEAQIQKSDIFKIKHANVIMNVHKDEQKGVAGIRVDNLPAGNYSIEGKDDVADLSALGVVSSFSTVAGTDDAVWAGIFKTDDIVALKADGSYNANSDMNLSLLFEVTSVDTAANRMTVSVKAMGVDVNGNSKVFNGGELTLNSDGMATKEDTKYAQMGFGLKNTAAMKLAAGDAAKFAVGDKMVFNIVASAVGGATVGIDVVGVQNADWNYAWGTKTDGTTDATLKNSFGFNATAMQNKEVHMKQYYLNTDNGTVHEGDVAVTFNSDMAAASTGTLATFEAAYVGQIAKGDVAMRDLDKFWDANGKFILEDPKTLSIVQGDGKQASVTLYSTDTINEVKTKLNDAIATGLGQGVYAQNSIDKFVTFVEDPKNNTSESVKGTFVIRSLVPGAAGEITLSGDEDVIKAFSLNEIQKSKETTYEVSINDAHSGNMVVSGEKITGSKLIGVLHENVDVVFDPMANTSVSYDASSARFVLARDANVYETTLHLADNTTVFQIGANEGEDMGINIGNMSAEALGVSNLIVTDRESAARSISVIDSAINKVSKQRAVLGAYQNRLEHTVNNLTTASTNLKSSESRIRDADMAKEMMTFTKLNILSQAGNSMLAQANQLPQSILSILR